MLKKVRNFLKCFIFVDLGAFVGKSIAVFIDYNKHPGIYAMRSAPWYTEILARGLATAIIVLLAWIAYILIGRKIRRNEAMHTEEAET